MITVSVASAAFRHPLLHAYCAIAEPSSCATLPKLNASLPLDPKRFGPIWSVPMHGATASTPRLIASCTTGAATTVHLPRALMLLLPVVVLVVPYRLGDTCSTGSRIRASQTRSNDPRARRASSAGATSHSESGHALPNEPLSLKISTS